MTKFVSYVSDEAIEKDAQALLTEYAEARVVVIKGPLRSTTSSRSTCRSASSSMTRTGCSAWRVRAWGSIPISSALSSSSRSRS